MATAAESYARARALMDEAKRLGAEAYYVAALRKVEEAEVELRVADRLARLESEFR